MQVKPIAAPVEARMPGTGSAGFFLAGGDLAQFTHLDTDTADEPSAWVAVPFGRDMLAGACMSPQNHLALTVDELAEMSSDEVRLWVLESFLIVGFVATEDEATSVRFGDGYHRDPVAAEFFTLLRARMDAAFGFPACSGRGQGGALEAPSGGLGPLETGALGLVRAVRGAA